MGSHRADAPADQVGDPIDPKSYGEEDQEKLMDDMKSAIDKNIDLDYGSLL